MITTWDRAELPYINDLSTTSRKTFIWVKILPHFYCCAMVVVSPSWSPPSTVIEREQVLELLAPTIVHQESANKFFEKGLHPIACSLHDGLFSIQVRQFRVMSSPPPALRPIFTNIVKTSSLFHKGQHFTHVVFICNKKYVHRDTICYFNMSAGCLLLVFILILFRFN